LLNRAWFEWKAHFPILQACAGFTEEMALVVKELHPKDRGALSEKQWAVLRYADAMTRDVEVKEEVFGEVKKGFNERELVEITATVASYNMVSRFLVALDVGECNGKDVKL
jgi:alkylhydroperoxidase family enzyme